MGHHGPLIEGRTTGMQRTRSCAPLRRPACEAEHRRLLVARLRGVSVSRSVLWLSVAGVCAMLSSGCAPRPPGDAGSGGDSLQSPGKSTSAAGRISAPDPPGTLSKTVERARFGILREEDAGQRTFVETSEVSHRVGQAYGWIIELRSGPGVVEWREVLELPAPAEQWNVDPSSGATKVSNDRRAATKSKRVRTENGVIANFWSVAPGDPRGDYRVEVFVNGKRAAVFTFTVE